MKKLLLSILTFVLCCTALANDCSTAIQVSVDTECNFQQFSVSTGRGKVCNADCGWVGYGYREVWLTTEMPSTGRLSIASEKSYVDGFIAIYRGTCGNLTPYRCSSNGRLPEVLEIPDLPAGERIYIRVALESASSVGLCLYQLESIVKPKCSMAAAAADHCADATLIQSPDGYCGNTSPQYSVDAPGNLQNMFCGSIENNSWLQFVAAESEASLNIFVNNCQYGIGIQMRIYGTDDCLQFKPYSNCWNPAIETNGVLTAKGLTPGKRYYLMIDGYAGDVCDYTISGGKGVEMPQTFFEESICKGRRYQKNGFDVDEAGVYRQELKGPNGKDSLVVLSLSVIDPVYSYISGSIYSCERYTQNGFDVNTKGKHHITLTTTQGCDSIVELDLDVIKQKEHQIYASICSGETYDQNGFKASEKGSYTRRLKTEQGCDSVVTLHLDVTASPEISVTGKTDVCLGDATVLTASGGSYYTWYDASGNEVGQGETLTVKPSATTTYKVVSSIEQKCPSSVTDCQGHTYRVVRIGEQCWMAENMKCSKYDTESELAGVELHESKSATYDPYYYAIKNTDCSGLECSELTPAIRAKLGYLYNWAAAVGVWDHEVYIDSEYLELPRQGICPNGWHLPTFDEYVELVVTVDGAGMEDDATKLKAVDGWYKENYIPGTDEYGFSLYPAGKALGSKVTGMGYSAKLYVVGPAYGEICTYCIAYFNEGALFYNKDYVEEAGDTSNKKVARSVRCVKN